MTLFETLWSTDCSSQPSQTPLSRSPASAEWSQLVTVFFASFWCTRYGRHTFLGLDITIFNTHDGSMVLLYMVTWIPSIYPSHVSIYTSTMDPSWDRYIIYKMGHGFDSYVSLLESISVVWFFSVQTLHHFSGVRKKEKRVMWWSSAVDWLNPQLMCKVFNRKTLRIPNDLADFFWVIQQII
jgi:hypothetical protein